MFRTSLLLCHFGFDESKRKSSLVFSLFFFNFFSSRDHLFLRCVFSESNWLLVLKRLGYRPVRFHTWTAFMDWMGLKDTICPTSLRRVAAQATVYSLWWERNNRLHNSVSTPVASIFKKIDRLVRNIVTARRD